MFPAAVTAPTSHAPRFWSNALASLEHVVHVGDAADIPHADIRVEHAGTVEHAVHGRWRR